VRVGSPGAAELERGDRGHAIFGWLEMRMLTGEDQARTDAAMEKRLG
jgi:hypothetical protein